MPYPRWGFPVISYSCQISFIKGNQIFPQIFVKPLNLANTKHVSDPTSFERGVKAKIYPMWVRNKLHDENIFPWGGLSRQKNFYVVFPFETFFVCRKNAKYSCHLFENCLSGKYLDKLQLFKKDNVN
jgi:hypothetical protein